MPSQQSEQTRGILAAAAIATAITALLCFRAIQSASAAGARPVPSADIQTLSAFLNPLPDSGGATPASVAGISVPRDPFSEGVATIRPEGRTVSAVRPGTPAVRGGWVVSSILLEGSRRSAIVNNAWVSIGDGIAGGAKVTAIEPDHVVVTDAKGVRHIVSIKGGA